MKPIKLVVQRDALLVPRLVEDACGNERVVAPADEDVPSHILLLLHGFPSDAATVDVVYPRPMCGEEKIFPLACGHIVLDRASGYLRRVLTMSPPFDQTHYDVLSRLLATYRAYARNLPMHDEWRWHAIFVSEIMSAYWADNEQHLSMLVRMPPAP